jgi:tetratricopeptide (TPR) repeat protein
MCSEHTGKLNDKTLAHINLLTKKLTEDSLNTDVRMQLGEIYQKNGLLKEALHEYQKVLDSDAGNFTAQSRCAQIHLKLKDLEKAERGFRAALHIDPSSTSSLVGLFRSYYLQNKLTEAIAVGNKLIAQKPENVEFHMLLKNLYKQKGDNEKLLAELLTLEKIIPDNENILRELADHYKNNDDLNGVIEIYGKMMAKKIEDLDLCFYIGVRYFKGRKYDEVIVHLTDMLKKDNIPPGIGAMIHAYLALSYFQKGDMRNTLNSISEIQPEQAQYMDPDMQKKLGAVFFTVGKNSYDNHRARDAILLLEKAIYFDNETAEYVQLLEHIKNEATEKYKLLMNKIIMIGGSILGGCLVLFVFWISIRNRIIITVQPAEGITITIDGDTIATPDDSISPVRSPIYFLGKHRVTIERVGYEPWHGSAVIGFASPAKLDVQLVPIYYTLALTSMPESAQVIIDGTVMGMTPFVSDEIAACPHSIELQRKGYAPWQMNLMLTEEDNVDLGIIELKNLAGKWTGEIGQNSFAYNASFSMTIEQTDDILTIKYYHQPREETKYSGTIKGKVENGKFSAQGKLTYKYYKVFYWAEEKRTVTMEGTLSDSWQRIEGSRTIESFAPETWWAQRR